MDVTQDPKVKEARDALKEAERKAEEDHFSEMRAAYGECPRYYGHPSWPSFWTGFCMAIALISALHAWLK